MSEPVYNPVQFLTGAEIITIAIIASFVTMKFLNSLYENIYEPMIETIVDSKTTGDYYVKIGKYYVQVGMIIKEFIKWFLLILVLMLLYNFIRNKNTDKNH
jgi:large-conductance mechanosensitive channel